MLKLLLFALFINYSYANFLSYGLDGNNRILEVELLEPEVCFTFDDCFETICGMLNHKNSTIDGYSVLAAVGVGNLINDCPYNYTHDYSVHMIIFDRKQNIEICNNWSCVIDSICKYNRVGLKGFCF